MRNGLNRTMLGVVLAAAMAAGCVTTQQVKSIVADANATAIASVRDIVTDANATGIAVEAPALDADPAATDPGWRETVARIEDFIIEHPDQGRTNHALRIREAVVLLNADQPNLARAVFDEIDRNMLGGTRDLAIYDAREHLIWWYGLGSTLADEDARRGREALTGIASVADGLEPDDYTRRFFEEMRVRIGVRLARREVTDGSVRTLLDDAAVRYAAQWNTQDQRAIQTWHGSDELEESASLRSLRWYDYVPAAFAEADAIMRAVCEATCPTYTPPWVQCIATSSC